MGQYAVKHMIRLAIDFSSFRVGKAIGFNEYALSLTEGLAAVPSDELELTLFVREGESEQFRAANPRAIIHPLPFRSEIGRLLWHHTVPWFLRQRFDAILFPANFAPMLLPRSSVLVVHDLNFLSNRESFGRLNLLYRQLIQRSSIQRCRGIIAISGSTAAEVERFGGRFAEVIHNAVRLRAPASVAVEKSLLCASSLSFHKNVPAAYEACLQHLEEDRDLTVTFIGNWRPEEFPARESHPRVRLLGFVSASERDRLFAACQGVLAPSRYEGFGMPYVEAMLSGKALICSDIPTAHEMIGDYGYWIPSPFGISEIVQALRAAREHGYASRPIPPQFLDQYRPEFVAQKYLRYIKDLMYAT